jgi:Fe-S-cluster containining protein
VEGSLACRRGCSYCCHGYVSATAPQIFAAAEAIRANALSFEAACARIQDTAMRVGGLDWRARIALREPCPLLAEGACSIYAERPLACRGYVSLSVAACKRAYEELTDEVVIPPVYASVRSALESALRAALRACALPALSYELTGALAKALESPDAEARWLAGEAVFDAASADRSAGAAAEVQREVMLDTLIACARGEMPELLAAVRPA